MIKTALTHYIIEECLNKLWKYKGDSKRLYYVSFISRGGINANFIFNLIISHKPPEYTVNIDGDEVSRFEDGYMFLIDLYNDLKDPRDQFTYRPQYNIKSDTLEFAPINAISHYEAIDHIFKYYIPKLIEMGYLIDNDAILDLYNRYL